MKVSAQPTDCRDFDGSMEFLSCTANREKNYIEFVLKTAMELESTTSRLVEVIVKTAVDLPTTTAKCDGIRLITSAGEERVT